MLRRNLSEKKCIFNLIVTLPVGVMLLTLVGPIGENSVVQDKGVPGVVPQ